MSGLSLTLVVLTGIAVGSAVGTIFGFSIASHHDVTAGARPKTSNRFIRWICRPTRELSFVQGLLFALAMLVWLVVFFALCAIPVLVAVKLGGEGSSLPAIALAALVAASYLARHLGRKLWQYVLHAA